MNVPLTFQVMIRSECKRRANFDPLLIAAIVQTESNYDPYALRFEINSPYSVDAENMAKKMGCSVQTEAQAQKFSYGLGQIMLSTARGFGFKEPAGRLFDPVTNIFWLCEVWLKMCMKYADRNDQIAAYNAGSPRKKADGTYINQEYVSKVLKAIASPQKSSPAMC